MGIEPCLPPTAIELHTIYIVDPTCRLYQQTTLLLFLHYFEDCDQQHFAAYLIYISLYPPPSLHIFVLVQKHQSLFSSGLNKQTHLPNARMHAPFASTAPVSVCHGQPNLGVPLRRLLEAVAVALVVHHRLLNLLCGETKKA